MSSSPPISPHEVLHQLGNMCYQVFTKQYGQNFSFSTRFIDDKLEILGSPIGQSTFHMMFYFKIENETPLHITLNRIALDGTLKYFDLNHGNNLQEWINHLSLKLDNWLPRIKKLIPFVLDGEELIVSPDSNAGQNLQQTPIAMHQQLPQPVYVQQQLPQQSIQQQPVYVQQQLPQQSIQQQQVYVQQQQPTIRDPYFFEQMHQYHDKVREIDEVLGLLTQFYASRPHERRRIQQMMENVNTKVKALVS